MTKNIKDKWQTPKPIYDKLNEEFNFDIDVACDRNDCLCEKGFCIDEGCDALEMDWKQHGTSFFMNPPYSRGNIDRFCKKAYEESRWGHTVVGLLRCDMSTIYFHDYILKAHEIRAVKRRVRFISPDTGKSVGSPPFASIIVVWRPRPFGYAECTSWDWK